MNCGRFAVTTLVGTANTGMTSTIVTLSPIIGLLLYGCVNGQDPPSVGLYFMLGNTIYFPGDTVSINDIGDQPTDRSDPGMTLVCVTTNVNTACCRNSDNNRNGPLGDFLDPTKRSVPAINSVGSASNVLFIVRSNQVFRLGIRGSPTGPLGVYMCVVPDMNGGDVTANITLSDTSPTTSTSITVTSMTSTSPPSTISSVSITPPNPSGTAGVSTITLSCTVALSGPGIPTISWSGPMTRGPITPEEVQTSFTDYFVLVRVRQSYAGEYTCEASIESSTMTTTVTVSVAAPEVSVAISGSQTPTALRSYTLMCVVTAPSTLDLTIRLYTWRRNGSIQPGQASSQLVFNSLPLSDDNAVYKCQYRASSVYLNNNVDVTTPGYTIRITIAPLTSAPSDILLTPQTVSVSLTWTQASLDVVDNYMISYRRTAGCNTPSGSRTISGLLRTYTLTGLEEDITYEITITAMNTRNSMSSTTRATTLAAAPGRVSNLQSSEVNYTSITVTWLSMACLQQNGEITYYSVRYTESSVTSKSLNTTRLSFTASSLFPGTSYTFEVAAVNSEGTGPYEPHVVTTVIPTDVGLLKGNLYSNNSVIAMNEIGQGSDGLFCFSNATNCCRNIDNPTGTRNWFFPDNSAVGIMGTQPISRSRGPGSLILHRDNTLEPSGIYRCQIFNSNMYFGIYPQTAGSSTVSSLTYNNTSGVVTCISTGGPATTVTWSRSGSAYQQSKIIVDTVTATYHNLLSITSSQISDYTGTFTCTVSNNRGSSSMTTGEFKSIGLTGIENIYTAGSSVSVICFSNFTVQSIQWLSSSSNIIYTTSMIGSQEILLSVTDISRSIDGSIFTCEVTNLLPAGIVTQRITITINTEERKSSPVLNIQIRPNVDNNLAISWTSPDMPRGIISSYLVLILDLSNNIYITNTTTIDETQINFVVTNLEAGVPYNIGVAAVNSKGVGELTSRISFTRELVPNISPQNVAGVRTSETSMTILWIKLTLVEARGYILNYTIAYYPLQNTTQQNSIIMYKVVDSEFSSTTIDGLDANSAYIVQVSANTVAGSGPLSTPLTIQLYALTQMTKTISVQSNTGSNIGAIMVSVVAIVIILVLVMIIVLLTIKMQRKSRYIASLSNEKSSPKDEFREYEKINIKSTQQSVVTTQLTSKRKEIGMTSCPAYGEVKNVSAYQNNEMQQEVPGVYETIQ